MNELMTAYIAIGSNLGDRLEFIESAVHDLDRSPGNDVFAMSDVIETAAIGTSTLQPFLNAAIAVRTSQGPGALLDNCLQIEAKHGRTRSAQRRWESRTLDLDLLLFGSQVIDEPGLHVPHPRMATRAFVLVPLAQIAPKHLHPVYHVTIADLLRQLQATTAVEYRTVSMGFEKAANSVETP